MLITDAHLSRLGFPTVFEDITEALGDTLEAVGGGVTPGERRPRPFNLNLPVHGDDRDEGNRLRRQVRSLMENEKARLEGLYFRFDADPEQNGWLIPAGGDLPYDEGGPTFGRYKLTLSDCYRVATPRTHRLGRRVELYDRRLSSTPRDILGTLYSTDFAAQSALALSFLPVAVSDALGTGRTVLTINSRAAQEGAVGFVVGRPDGDGVNFEQAEELRHRGDVVLLDRRGNPWPAVTALDGLRNLATNPSGEGGSGTWGAAPQFSRSRTSARAYAGRWSHRSTYVSGTADSNMMAVTFTADAAGAHVAGIYVWIPSAYNGGGVSVGFEGLAGGTNFVNGTADMAKRDQWQLVRCSVTIAAGDLSASLVVRNTGAWPTAGRFIDLDAVCVHEGTTFVGYFDGDYAPVGKRSSWSGAAHSSISYLWDDPQGDYGWEELYGPDHDLSTGDAPAIENGLCRLLYTGVDGTNFPGVFQLEQWTGIEWTERGRFTFWRDYPAGTSLQYGHFARASVVEWTPERAVIRVRLAISSTSLSWCDVYVTLQRGWTGPRFEMYPEWETVGVQPGCNLRYSPLDAGGHVRARSTEIQASFEGWATDVGDFSTAEPWAVLQSYLIQDHTVAFAVLQEDVHWQTTDDTVAYGSTRRAVYLNARYGTPAAGYLSVTVGLAAEGSVFEAETYRNASGTTSQVADGAASGGQAIEETQTAQNANTVYRNPHAVPAGKYGVWVRARVVNAGATGSLLAGFNGAGGSFTPIVGTTSTTYVWVYLGEATSGNSSFVVNAWRSAGTGNVRVDEVVLVPTERRDATNLLYTGARDLAQSNLYDSRSVPTLVER